MELPTSINRPDSLCRQKGDEKDVDCAGFGTRDKSFFESFVRRAVECTKVDKKASTVSVFFNRKIWKGVKSCGFCGSFGIS